METSYDTLLETLYAQVNEFHTVHDTLDLNTLKGHINSLLWVEEHKDFVSEQIALMEGDYTNLDLANRVVDYLSDIFPLCK